MASYSGRTKSSPLGFHFTIMISSSSGYCFKPIFSPMAIRSRSIFSMSRTTAGVFSALPNRQNPGVPNSILAALHTIGGVWVIAL